MNKKIILIFLFAFILLIRISFVSAAEDYSCLETNNGNLCQGFFTEQTCNDACTSTCLPTIINNIAECKIGICYDNIEGACQANSPRGACESDGGVWFDKTNPSEVSECQKGCCNAGTSSFYITQTTCDRKKQLLNRNYIFQPGTGEMQCLNIARAQADGACVKASSDGEKTCRRTTQADCGGDSGEFYEGFLCSYPELESGCEREKETKCFEGRDEVYWIDSCGNRENIYEGSLQSQKDHSWNDGKALGKSQACNLGTSSNPLANQETCGNCNLLTSSMRCGEKTSEEKLSDSTQDVVCRYTGCVDDEGNRINNGESWCVYQSAFGIDSGAFGFGRAVDPPGSEYFRKRCQDGEIILDSCGEQRGRVCVETETENGKFATCRINDYSSCIQTNEIEDKEEKIRECENNADCFVKNLSINSGTVLCVPKIPPGTDDLCELGNIQCTSTWKKTWSFRYKCIANCECHSSYFTEQALDYCMSLGDCGASVNYIGNLTIHYGLTGAYPSKARESYFAGLLNYSNPTYEVMNLANYVENASILDKMNNPRAAEDSSLRGAIFTGAGLVIGFAVGGPIGMIVGGAVGAIVGITKIAEGIGNILGIGKEKSHTVKFTCRPWEAPRGGVDCRKCGTDGFPCSKYACVSLGTLCEFLNEGTPEQECLSTKDPDDVAPPRISPLEGNLTEGYSYSEETDNGFRIISSSGDGCVMENENIKFGIQLDEPGQCSASVEEPSEEVAEQDEYYVEDELLSYGSAGNREELSGGLYLSQHLLETFIPSLVSLGISDVGPSVRGEFRLKIECEDASPNSNRNPTDYFVEFCIKPGEDLAVPVISKIVPEPGYVKSDAVEQSVVVYLNEPAECKWSAGNVVYDLMGNNMSCEVEPLGKTIFGWPCNMTVPILSTGSSKVYVSCKDQPWEINDSKRNVNDAREIEYTRSPVLTITKISPKNETKIFGIAEDTIVSLSAETSGGSSNGEATCYLRIGQTWFGFENTESTSHSQTNLRFPVGYREIPVRCTDRIGNEANTTSSFTIAVDSSIPNVTRAYLSSGGRELTVVTNEPATCYYNEKTCNFDLRNESQRAIFSGTSRIHTIQFSSLKTYYTRCVDNYGNYPSGCSIILRGGAV